ncbi:hypothetical protein HK096_010728, partial [Nowakowskiella sp. JEL0078]
ILSNFHLNMHIFVTGATGYIGRTVTEKALNAGHTVHGLSFEITWSNSHQRDLTTFDVLSYESAKADAVLHLAYIHDFTMDRKKLQWMQLLRLCEEQKPLVITSGLFVKTDPDGGETNEDTPYTEDKTGLNTRIYSELHALGYTEDNVRVSIIRLPGYVYGRGGSYFIPMLMQIAANIGESIYVDDGSWSTSAVDVDDAADLYLIVAKDAKAGSIINSTSTEHFTFKEIAQAIGDSLDIPAHSVTRDQAVEKWGPFLESVVRLESKASNRKAIEELRWKPNGIDLLTDLRKGPYKKLAGDLEQKTAFKK